LNLKNQLKEIAIFQIIRDLAKIHNIKTYVIGGYVRDLIIERNSKDIDIVCLGSGILLAQLLKNNLGESASLTIYKQFRTACVKYQKLEIEFVGARKESYRSESRKAIVEEGTLEEDQNRRDFTINSLAISLNKKDFGELLDPFGGITDLASKSIKTPLNPEDTFSDDPLRMLRAIRFASQLNFDIESDTFFAIRKMSSRITIVSQERITSELNKIILSKKPSYGLNLLFQSGLLKIIFPEFHKLHGVLIKEGKSHKDNFFHTLQVLDNISKVTDDLWLRWAAILHDIAKPVTQRFNKKVGWTFHGHEDKGAQWVPGIFKKMKLPLNNHMKLVQKLVRLHLRPIALISKNVTDAAIRRLMYEAGDDIDDLLMLCKADITSKNNNRVQQYLMNFKIVENKIKKVELKDSLRNFKNPISGEEIMKIFDLEPSRIVGQLKEMVKEAIIENKIPNQYDAAIHYIKKEGKSQGLALKQK
tara:strand:+ start:798 stop:2219 length:1422 start_codon:yes stop_codon:yes gene_type:complete